MSHWRWASAEEWDGLAARSPGATPFHARAWNELYCEFDRRYRAGALIVALENARELLLPLVVRRGVLRVGPLARAASSHPNVYGGPIAADSPLGDEDWRLFVAALAHAPLGKLDCFGNVLEPLPRLLEGDLEVQRSSTHLIALGALPENPRSSFSKGCKHALTKSQRAGVRVERLKSSEEVSEYHAVYRDSLRRWSKDADEGYPEALFARLLELPGSELWGARMPDGRIAAGGVFLFARRQCVWWQGAMLEELQEAAPSNALIHHLLQVARERGCEWFDFNPSGGHTGVEAFKSSFGAERVEFATWKRRPYGARRRDRGERAPPVA